MGLTCRGEQIRNERKRVPIFFRDFVKSPKVDTKSERSIFLPNEEDWSSMRGVGGMDETNPKMFINELLESGEFGLRERVHGIDGRRSIFLQIDLEIIRTMQS